MPKRYKVLVTGSSGMLGIDLCEEIKRDYEVIGVDLVRVQGTGYRVQEFYEADITDGKRVEVAIGKVRPDIVIHCAAWTDVDGCELDPKKAYAVNYDGTKNVATACKKSGAALIYISTDFVFDGRKKTLYRETDKTCPLSVYGDSKLKGEVFAQKILKNYFILRTSWLYGKHGKNFVDTIIAKAKTEDILKVVKDQVGSPTCTVYLSKAIHALLNKITRSGCSGFPAPFASLRCGAGRVQGSGYRGREKRVGDYGIYHVSTTGRVSWYDYAREILRLVKSGTKVVPITSEQLNRSAKRPSMSVMDNSKFAKFTGYRMPGWRMALKEYLSRREAVC